MPHTRFSFHIGHFPYALPLIHSHPLASSLCFAHWTTSYIGAVLFLASNTFFSISSIQPTSIRLPLDRSIHFRQLHDIHVNLMYAYPWPDMMLIHLGSLSHASNARICWDSIFGLPGNRFTCKLFEPVRHLCRTKLSAQVKFQDLGFIVPMVGMSISCINAK